jgi:hypothetical protein
MFWSQEEELGLSFLLYARVLQWQGRVFAVIAATSFGLRQAAIGKENHVNALLY